MIFLCFSSKDRYTIAESILYHLKNYGLKVWYDYHTLILGDDKIEENINNGVYKSKYVILILSPNFYDCECGNMELDEIKKLHDLKKLHIFPILYNVKAKDLSKQYSWITNMIYNELSNDTPSLPTCNQIICQILKDEIISKKYQSFCDIKANNDYINNLISSYKLLDNQNITAKLTILFCINEFLKSFQKDITSHFCCKILSQLFKYTALNLKISFKELIIAEQSINIILNEKGFVINEIIDS